MVTFEVCLPVGTVFHNANRIDIITHQCGKEECGRMLRSVLPQKCDFQTTTWQKQKLLFYRRVEQCYLIGRILYYDVQHGAISRFLVVGRNLSAFVLFLLKGVLPHAFCYAFGKRRIA